MHGVTVTLMVTPHKQNDRTTDGLFFGYPALQNEHIKLPTHCVQRPPIA